LNSETPDILVYPSNKKLEILSQSQLDILKAGTMHLLEDIGVRFPSQKALEIFAEHG
jgi:trimethylamine:corrinoid methyltransferase-like protein